VTFYIVERFHIHTFEKRCFCESEAEKTFTICGMFFILYMKYRYKYMKNKSVNIVLDGV